MTAPDRPYSAEAEAALYYALSRYMQIAVLRHGAGVGYAEFSPTGDRVVTASLDRTARIWSAENGSAVAVLKGHEASVRQQDLAQTDAAS